MYGFPPGVGATGTAALLNVPRSLEALLARMKGEGYDLVNPAAGDGDTVGGGERSAAVKGAVAATSAAAAAAGLLPYDGEALVTGLKMQEDQRALVRGAAGEMD